MPIYKRTLADASIGECCRISAVTSIGERRRRLLDLGLVSGTKIEPLLSSLSGGGDGLSYTGNAHCNPTGGRFKYNYRIILKAIFLTMAFIFYLSSPSPVSDFSFTKT